MNSPAKTVPYQQRLVGASKRISDQLSKKWHHKHSASTPISPLAASPTSFSATVSPHLSPKSSFTSQANYFQDLQYREQARSTLAITQELHRVAAASHITGRKKQNQGASFGFPDINSHRLKPRQTSKPLEPQLLDNIISSYAFRTRTGENGSKPKKQNQDAYLISPIIPNIPGQYLFAVCDGHGTNGHDVSSLITEQLPKSINSSYLSSAGAEDRLSAAVLEGFRRVVACVTRSHIDVTFSGSTCISVILSGRYVLCANVGDSRAILIRRHSDNWQVVELSTDHKPDSPEERSRILSQGGRVFPLQINGAPKGPARVWIKTENIPGLAMSRSIGDLVAKQVGVTSEPELCSRYLTSEDKIIVLGSDGLWEFVTNTEVARIAGECWANNDIEGACEALVRTALERWRVQDQCVDDITVVVIFLSIPQ